MDATQLTTELKGRASELGFQAAGVCAAVPPAGFERLREWLKRGYGGEMRYLSDREAAYEHPRHVLEGVRSLLMLLVTYRSDEPAPPESGQGRVSCYAWGQGDYHDVIHERLKALKEFHLQLTPQARVRGVVDTAPLMERDFAQLAGLGWMGKNTLLLNKQFGSWFFLAALLTDAELEADQPFTADHCGTCRACLDACPTDAFPEPYVLDARRCISYLTIELRGSIPETLRPQLGDWMFGCDICQEVCPWNHRAPVADEETFAPRADMNPIELAELFALDEAAFRARFRATPLWRARRRGVLRNAALILGNQGHAAALPALARGLEDAEPLVRAASAWALGRLPDDAGRPALEARLSSESDPEVLYALRDALAAATA